MVSQMLLSLRMFVVWLLSVSVCAVPDTMLCGQYDHVSDDSNRYRCMLQRNSNALPSSFSALSAISDYFQSATIFGVEMEVARPASK